MTKTRDCVCRECVAACKTVPGWFAPGEAEKAATHLGMSFEDFKNEYLIQEFWTGSNPTDVLAPRKINQPRGFKRADFFDPWRRAPCIFLENDRCKIHAAKPHMCSAALLCDETVTKGFGGTGRRLAARWARHWKKTPRRSSES